MAALIDTDLYSDASLVSYYRLEGNSNDDIGGYNGTDTGVTYGTAYGTFGQGGTFTGTSVIGVGDNAAHEFTGDFTINFWSFRDTGTVTNLRTLSKGANTNAVPGYVFFGGTATCAFGIGNGTTRSIISTGTLTPGVWNMITGVRNGGTQSLLVNGTLNGTMAPVSVNLASARDLQFGADTVAGAYHIGYLDDISLFSRALTASEIGSLYAPAVPRGINSYKSLLGVGI